MNHIASLGCLFFTPEPVTDYRSAKTSDTKAYAAYCNAMLERGIYPAPAQFEAMFLSMAHTERELEEVLNGIRSFFIHMKEYS